MRAHGSWRTRWWPVTLLAGCAEFLPGSDRTRDAAALDVAPEDRSPTDSGAARDVPAPSDSGVMTGCGGSGRGGQACCAGDRCNEAYVCVRAVGSAACQPCGGSREPCCAGGTCDDRRDCRSNDGQTPRCQ